MTDQKPLSEAWLLPKEATEPTRKANLGVYNQLPFEDRKSFENAAKGFLGSLDEVVITRPADGRVVFNLADLAFLQGELPDTVNPSLWRQAGLNALNHGLFEVVKGLYQVRSF